MTSFDAPPGDAPHPSAVHPRDATADSPTSVSRLNDTIRDHVRRWSAVWVEGEITSWGRRGTSVFGGLKDAEREAQLSFSVWSDALRRVPDDIKVGDRVIMHVKPDYFSKRGSFSFSVQAVRHVGLGDQLERLERLRAQLRLEGLFEDSRKKPVPFLPGVIGLITGERSDAEKDVRRNAELRWPIVRFHTQYSAVQGERCVPEVLAALAQLDADPEVDVIIIARGGGDPQDLLGFSDERLVRAVAAASTPVVSAIGHENDHPVLDDVADLRASTPTDAAKRVVPDVAEQRAIVRDLGARLTRRLADTVAADIRQLEQLRSRPVLADPQRMIRDREQDLFYYTDRARGLVERSLHAHALRTAQLRASLAALSPQATLARGYAIAQTGSGAIVRSSAQAPAGTTLAVTLANGSISAVSGGAREESDPHETVG